MSYKNRIKFTVAGVHPLLYLLRDRLIHQGFALVGNMDEPDFLLFGAQDCSPSEISVVLHTPIPTFLLSSSNIYSDRTRTLELAKKVPMSENHACVVTSPLEPMMGRTLFALLAEWTFTCKTRTMVIRPFNIYGPDIKYGVIHEWLKTAKRGEALNVHGSGYQTRTYLYQDDFYACFDKLLKRFLKGARGIYNIGHDQEISLKRLADSIWQLTHGPNVVMLSQKVKSDSYHAQWKLPDITRVKAFAGWKPRTSLRSGLFLMVDPHRR